MLSVIKRPAVVECAGILTPSSARRARVNPWPKYDAVMNSTSAFAALSTSGAFKKNSSSVETAMSCLMAECQAIKDVYVGKARGNSTSKLGTTARR